MKNWFELIEKYIDKDLDADELEMVKKLLANNPEFAKDYKLSVDINLAIAEKDTIILRRNLKEIHRNYKKDTGTTIRKLYNKRWHLAAAAITIFILLGNVLINNYGSSKHDDIFNQFYQTESSIMITRSSDSSFDTDLREALNLYSNAQYQDAIEIFIKHQNNVISNFYIGLSYIETNNFEKAIKAFQTVLDHNDNLFIEQAEWYKALCLIKLNQTEKATELLQIIKKSNSLFNEQAGEVLTAIK